MYLSRLSRLARSRRSFLLIVGIGFSFVTLALSFGINSAQAKTPLGRNWPANQQLSMEQIDHSGFNTLLGKYVDNDGYVDYSGWHSSASDRQTLQNYINHLSRATSRRGASRSAHLAFWINAYNAVTLEGILQEYPTTSIRNHTSKLSYNIWQDLPLLVDGKAYSLENIEHKVLRPMNEPRIHFAIVCASVGCPRLMNRAYTEDSLEKQLTENSRDFFSRSQNLRVDASRRTLHFSSIMKWYGKDFGRTTREQLAYLRPYLPSTAQQVVAQRASVRYLSYDWNLNDQSRKPRSASRR